MGTSQEMGEEMGVAITSGSGNVFADIRLADAETHMHKAELVARIDRIVRVRRLTLARTAALLGISEPDVSRLLRGNFRDHSVERLFHLLSALEPRFHPQRGFFETDARGAVGPRDEREDDG